MSKSNDELYKAALAAIQDLFSDTSVSPESTKASLRSLVEELQMLIDSIKDGE